MAKNKNYLIVKFQTEEDFKKHFDSIYQNGYESGYQDGIKMTLSYYYDLLDHFGTDMRENAAYLSETRKKDIAIRQFKEGKAVVMVEDPAYREQKEKLKSILESNKFLEEVKRLKEEKNKEL